MQNNGCRKVLASSSRIQQETKQSTNEEMGTKIRLKNFNITYSSICR